jgi:amino acid transporter/mannitol/fructose-specific phosphotransferase system IIA component (Ntr-type)
MSAGIKRQLGFLDVFSITAGAMISSGLFILPGIAYTYTGPALVFSYLIAGIATLSGMLSTIEIVTAMPMAGGNYFFIARTMGPAVGTVAGILSWFSLALKSSFALAGLSIFLVMVVDWNYQIAASVICIAFIGVNIIGSRETGKLQIVLVALLLALMLFYVGWGSTRVQGVNILPFAPNGWLPVFSTAGLIFISYGGLMQVASVAEEIRNPGRVIPQAMIAAFLVIVLVYILMIFVTAGVLSPGELSGSLTPITTGAAAFMGRTGTAIMTAAAILAFVSTANAGIMTASRYLFSLSRDNLLPEFFGTMNARFETPHRAVIATGIVIVATLFLELEILAEAASTVLILSYLLSSLCLIILRESRILNYHPVFRSPWYPVLPIAGIAGYLLLLVGVGWDAVIITGVLIAGGLLFYLVYGKVRSRREYALLHLVERVSARELTSGLLESELRQIVIDRDDMGCDIFGDLVKEAIVIDLSPAASSRDELFRSIAGKLGERLGMNAGAIEKDLHERHGRESTTLQPGCAVSDIIMEGNGTFEVVLVRSRQGIPLEEIGGRIHAFFLLAASRDRRNLYLLAVSSIAQLIQDAAFEKRWLDARSPQQLRDLLVLGGRRRVCTL